LSKLHRFVIDTNSDDSEFSCVVFSARPGKPVYLGSYPTIGEAEEAADASGDECFMLAVPVNYITSDAAFEYVSKVMWDVDQLWIRLVSEGEI